MNSEIFSITVPVPRGTYPSVNHTAANASRRGKKTPEYHELFMAVRDAAAREIARLAWTPVDAYYDTTVIRIRSDLRKSDMSNLAKCELDALEPSREPRFTGDLKGYGHPFPGAFLNDNLVVPTFRIEYDPDGVDRVTIVIRRIYPFVPTARERAAVAIGASPAKKPPKRTPEPVRLPAPDRRPHAGGRVPMLNGKPISPDDAAALVRKFQNGG